MSLEITGNVILAPALIAPRSRIANKIIPFGIETSEGNEYIITQFNVAVGAIKDVTVLFRKYSKTVITNNAIATVLLTTLGEIPLKFALAVNTDFVDSFELDNFVDKLQLKKVTSFNVENVRDLVKQYVNIASTRYRVYEIRPIPFMLVYCPSMNILTRLCWLDDISGNVELYTYKNINVVVADRVSIKNVFIEKIEPDNLEDYIPVNVPELIDQVSITEKLIDFWNREIAKIRRSEAKRRALELLKGELTSGEVVEKHARTEEESPEERVET